MLRLLNKALFTLRIRWMGISAPMLFVQSFGLLIALGTAGLMLIPGLQAGPPLGFIDALFTMTSAVCVTGLIVVDTATHFTRWGQLWILLFIQLGGIGLVTLTTLIIGAMGRRLSLRSEMIVGVPVDQEHRPVRKLTFAVARYTLLIEAAGALLLWVWWLPRFGFVDAGWHAMFHAVSAFCNAGFSTFTDSLIGFNTSPLTLLLISFLIIAGSVGFLSTEEVIRWWRAHKVGRARMSVHTWAALLVTLILLIGGFIAYALAEWNASLGGLSVVDRISNAWFLSVTARTAGFNSVSYSALTNSGALLTIMLMLVGGSPGSTAGGLKTTTIAVLMALAITRIRGRKYTMLHGRTVPEGTVQRTVSLVMVVGALLVFSIFLIGILESRSLGHAEARMLFLPLVFEAVSAFCTVGLSMDVTPGLNAASRLLMVLLMFIGRVGPLVFFAAISLRLDPDRVRIREAAEDLIVG